jgi:integrase
MFRRGKVYWCQNNLTRKQESLETKDRSIALRLLHAKNEAALQPYLNLRIAQTYLAATDEMLTKRTWQDVMRECLITKTGKTRARYERAVKETAFDLIRSLPLIETQAEHLLNVLQRGSVSTNNYLRRLHNFALAMNWLPWPVLPKRQWPAVLYKEKRAITAGEHRTIVLKERNDEHRAFYEVCWHVGGSQSDVATLKADDIDWGNRVVSFFRRKTGTIQIIRFGGELEAILRKLPSNGRLFSKLALLDEKHRASLFQRACRRAGVTGVSLHSYRYSWAERAKVCGYPERFAQEALGHNSKAVHRAYARKAQVTLPALEEYEKQSIT